MGGGLLLRGCVWQSGGHGLEIQMLNPFLGRCLFGTCWGAFCGFNVLCNPEEASRAMHISPLDMLGCVCLGKGSCLP
jgi:hypothetical protein